MSALMVSEVWSQTRESFSKIYNILKNLRSRERSLKRFLLLFFPFWSFNNQPTCSLKIFRQNLKCFAADFLFPSAWLTHLLNLTCHIDHLLCIWWHIDFNRFDFLLLPNIIFSSNRYSLRSSLLVSWPSVFIWSARGNNASIVCR